MAASDSIVGEGLVDSPYEELRKKYEALAQAFRDTDLFGRFPACTVAEHLNLAANFAKCDEENVQFMWQLNEARLEVHMARAERDAYAEKCAQLNASRQGIFDRLVSRAKQLEELSTKYEELKFRMEGLEK